MSFLATFSFAFIGLGLALVFVRSVVQTVTRGTSDEQSV